MSRVSEARREVQQCPITQRRAHLCDSLTPRAGLSCAKHEMACVGQKIQSIAAWPKLVACHNLEELGF